MIDLPKLVQDERGLATVLPCWDVARHPAIPHVAVIYCPAGHVGFLRHHTVKDDGTVSPACICSRLGCTFHEHVRLIGWKS